MASLVAEVKIDFRSQNQIEWITTQALCQVPICVECNDQKWYLYYVIIIWHTHQFVNVIGLVSEFLLE